MRIGGFRVEPAGDGDRISARVTWEDSDRAPFEMRFDRSPAPSPAAAGLHPFLLASVVPAWRGGERRIRIEGAVCPRLRDNLTAATRLLSQWWQRPPRLAPAIEASAGFRPFPSRPDRCAIFLTAGVDSSHALLANRKSFPTGHPASFRDAIYAVRLAFLEPEPSPRALDLAARQIRAIGALARASGLETVLVDSNFRLIESDVWLAGRHDHGALLASVAHALAGRIGAASIGASFDVHRLWPWGSHPLLDPLFGSSGVEIRHEAFGPTRSEKIAEIAGWPAAMENLLVCFEGPLPSGRLNCGRCEKCLRTMTALVTIGAHERCAAFAGERPTAEKIDAMSFGYVPANVDEYWGPLVEPLERRGESRLARAVRAKIAAARRMLARESGRDFRGRLGRVRRTLRMAAGRRAAAS